MRTKTDEESIHALEDVDRKLSEMCAEENAKIIKDACGGLTRRKTLAVEEEVKRHIK